MCVKSTIKRRLHQSEYRGFTTRCKPLVSLKNRKARLEFAKRHLKKPSQFWNNILWTDETKINLYQSDGKRRVWRRKGTAVVNFFLVEAETRRRWDIFQAEVPLY